MVDAFSGTRGGRVGFRSLAHGKNWVGPAPFGRASWGPSVKEAGAPRTNQSLTTPQPTAPGPPRPRPRRHQRGAGPCRCCRSPGRWRVGRLVSRLVHHRALGADPPHRCRQSRDGRRPSEDIKADPGAGVPATSGVESYSAATLDGWRRRGTNRRPAPVSELVRRTASDHAERRTASASWITEPT